MLYLLANRVIKCSVGPAGNELGGCNRPVKYLCQHEIYYHFLTVFDVHCPFYQLSDQAINTLAAKTVTLTILENFKKINQFQKL